MLKIGVFLLLKKATKKRNKRHGMKVAIRPMGFARNLIIYNFYNIKFVLFEVYVVNEIIEINLKIKTN